MPDIKLTFKTWNEIENDVQLCIVVDPECATDVHILHNGEAYTQCGVDVMVQPDRDHDDLYVKLLTNEELGYVSNGSRCAYPSLHRPDEETILAQMPKDYDYVSFTSI